MDNNILTFSKLENGRPDDGWLPTNENINALPSGVKNYIHDLTAFDPGYLVRENALLRDNLKECHDYITLLKREKIMSTKSDYEYGRGRQEHVDKECSCYNSHMLKICHFKEEPEFDFELDSLPSSKGGTTLCGKTKRKHKMKRFGPMSTRCIYPGCDACC